MAQDFPHSVESRRRMANVSERLESEEEALLEHT
jgi:hypothetical protein